MVPQPAQGAGLEHMRANQLRGARHRADGRLQGLSEPSLAERGVRGLKAVAASSDIWIGFGNILGHRARPVWQGLWLDREADLIVAEAERRRADHAR